MMSCGLLLALVSFCISAMVPSVGHPWQCVLKICVSIVSNLLTCAHRSRCSIGHQRPLAIALCSGFLWSFRTSWSPAVSALLQCLASNCCEAGLSSCGFQVRAWRVVLDAGFLRVDPIQSHHLPSICLATGSCPARSYRSSLWIFSCHWIL